MLETAKLVKMTTGMGTTHHTTCPTCGRFYRLTREKPGEKVLCPACYNSFLLGSVEVRK